MSLEITSETNEYPYVDKEFHLLFKMIDESNRSVILDINMSERGTFEDLKNKKLAELQAEYDASRDYDSLAKINEFIFKCHIYMCFSSMIDAYKKLLHETFVFIMNHEHLRGEENQARFEETLEEYRKKGEFLTGKIQLFEQNRVFCCSEIKYHTLHSSSTGHILSKHYPRKIDECLKYIGYMKESV